jgi:ketosteroid isomerase-like protein
MKRLIIAGLLAICSLSIYAQNNDEKLVAKAVENLRVAMIDADRTALENLTADSLSYGHSGGKVERKSDFVENIVSGKSDFVTINLSDQTISIVNNLAIVRHTLNATTNDGGKPGTVKIHVLLVWQKYKKEWKLVARQAVKIPV